MSGKFLYFGYASNLLAKRLQISSPNAKRYGTGKLNDFRIDFATYLPKWKGASATIVESEGDHVWGAIWEMDVATWIELDKQEGVDTGIYAAREMDIETENKGVIKCWVYQQSKPPKKTENLKELPKDRLPSGVYLKIIKMGAKETELPEQYLDFLTNIPDNGYFGEIEVNIDLSDA